MKTGPSGFNVRGPGHPGRGPCPRTSRGATMEPCPCEESPRRAWPPTNVPDMQEQSGFSVDEAGTAQWCKAPIATPKTPGDGEPCVMFTPMCPVASSGCWCNNPCVRVRSKRMSLKTYVVFAIIKKLWQKVFLEGPASVWSKPCPRCENE